MKTVFLLAVFAALFQQIPPQPTGRIEGYVVVAGSSRPIAGASVFLAGPPSNRPDPRILTTSDAAGHFVFQDVPAPRATYYRVGAGAAGFDSTFDEVPFKAGQSLSNVVVTLMTGGNVRGRLTDPEGAPVAGIPIFVYQEGHIWVDPPRFLMPYRAVSGASGLLGVDRIGTDANLGQPIQVPGGGNLGAPLVGGNRAIGIPNTPPPVQTALDGTFLIQRLPPGQYFVGVEFPVGYSPNPNGFATTFYPGVTDSTKARPIRIEPEGDIRGIDFSVQKPSRFTVSGRIENLPSGVGSVVLHPPGENRNMAPAWSSRINPDGSFRLPNVLPGAYELSPSTSEIRFSLVSLAVEVRGDVNGIVLRLPPMTEITGTLTAELRPGDVQLPESVILALDGPGTSSRVQLRAPGPFTISPVAAGTHSLPMRLAPMGYTLDVQQGTHNVVDDQLVEVRNTNTEPLVVHVRPANFSIIVGKIQAADGQTKIADVLLVPDGARRANPMEYQTARSKSDGTFKMDTVLPGNYKLFAWEFGRVPGLGPYMSPNALLEVEKFGVPVVVPSSGSVTVDVPLIPR